MITLITKNTIAKKFVDDFIESEKCYGDKSWWNEPRNIYNTKSYKQIYNELKLPGPNPRPDFQNQKRAGCRTIPALPRL